MATSPMFFEFDRLRHRWGWLLTLGIVMVFLGTVALFMIPAATLGTVLVLGWLLVISGIVEAVQAFRVRRWGGMFLHLIGGILGILVGLLVVTHPVAGALAWTMLFASFFTVIGIFRLVTAIRLKFPNWGWAVFDGAVTLALGILLWVQWPWSALWFLGLAVGVSLILRGWSYIMFSIAVRNLAVPPIPIRQAA
ncbi:MAG: hypothetical protein JWO91_2803 [Acidobacteriaceae bacterium]|nr:hypothetical protein [Acidobacteriaceae bacterium]